MNLFFENYFVYIIGMARFYLNIVRSESRKNLL
jgi:hypothetical protein